MVRYRNRYILSDIIFPHDQEKDAAATLQTNHVYRAIKDAMVRAHGDYGIALVTSSLSVKYLNPETNIVVVRTKRGTHQLVQSAMAFVKNIGEQEAFFRTLHVGGTIRSCKKFLLTYHKQQLPLFQRQCKTDEEKREFQLAILDACAKLEGDASQSVVEQMYW